MTDKDTKPAAQTPRRAADLREETDDGKPPTVPEPVGAVASPSSPAAAARKTPDAWAAAKRADPFLVAGAVGRERAARRWDLHSDPLVTEAEFDAALAAFTNLEMG